MISDPAAWAADLHIHSHFSRATAKGLNPAAITLWAARKGLTLVGTGDLTPRRLAGRTGGSPGAGPGR